MSDHLSALELIVWGLQLAGYITLSLKLVWRRLYPKYPVFLSFLLFQAAATMVMSRISYGTNLYAELYMFFEILGMVFFGLVIWELYRIVLKDLSGLARLARSYMIGALIVSGASSLLVLLVVPANTFLARFFLVESVFLTALLLLVLLMTGFLAYYPVSLNRNVVTYSVGYVMFFLSKSATLLARNLLHDPNLMLMNTVFLGTSLAVLAWWIVQLNAAGEFKELVIGHPWGTRADQRRVLDHLAALNASLVQNSEKR